MAKIIGNTTATPNPRPDWNQTDETKADYIKNKPNVSNAIRGIAKGEVVAITDISPIKHTMDVKITGIDNPENVTISRCGKNIIGIRKDFHSTTNGIKGLTITFDHTTQEFTLNGTVASGVNVTHLLSGFHPIVKKNNAYTLTVEHISGEVAGNEKQVSAEILSNYNKFLRIYLAESGRTTATATAPYDGELMFALRAVEGGTTFTDYKFRLQLEVGATATEYEPYTCETYTPNADGIVEGITYLHPNITLLTDAGAVIECEYNKDTNKENDILKAELDSAVTLASGAHGRIETVEARLNEKMNDKQDKLTQKQIAVLTNIDNLGAMVKEELDGAIEDINAKTEQSIKSVNQIAEKALADAQQSIDDIEHKATETLATIPEDYIKLDADVKDVASGKGIKENAITPNQTTFFYKNTTYGNLFDSTTCTKGVRLNCKTGESSASTDYTSDYIPVEVGESYFIGRANGTMGQDMYNVNSWAFYDENKNFIPQDTKSVTGGWNPIPEGVAYMRVSVLYYTSVTMVVKGTEAPTAYVSYQDGISINAGWKDDDLRKAVLKDTEEYMEENFLVDGSKIIERSIPLSSLDSVTEYNLNLVNPNEIETKKSINDKGETADNTYNDVTGFIPVKATKKYYLSNLGYVYFYDQNKKYIRRITWSSANNLLAGFEVPSDGFIRVSFNTGNTMAVNDYGINIVPAEYGTKKFVYTDENGTIFPQAVNDAGVVSAFEWKKINLADKDKCVAGNVANGVFNYVGTGGNFYGYIIDVTAGTDYVFSAGNNNPKKVLQYDENWGFVSELTVSVNSDIQRFLYTAPDGVAHIAVQRGEFFAELSDLAIEVMKMAINNGIDLLSVQYAPVNIAEYNRQIIAKTLLADQSELLQKTIHQSEGLKWCCLGDSLTAYNWGNDMYSMVSKILGLTPVGYGIGSSTIGDYKNDGVSGNPMCIRYAEMDDDADIVTVMGGTNDYNIGTMEDRDKTTLYGACHVLFSGLIEKYPNAKIGVILPPQNGQGIPSYVQTQGGDPNMNGMRAKVNAIREVAEYYSLPVCDLFNHGGISGMSQNNIGRLLQADYLHITTEGYKVLSRPLLAFIKDLIG